MSNKLLQLILYSLFLISTTRADNQSYYPPQTLKNCHFESQIPRCEELNNNFLKLLSNTKDGFGGDYVFEYAIASNSLEPFYKPAYFIEYYYKNAQGHIVKLWGGYANSMAPDIKASGNTWIEYTNPDHPNYRCINNTVNCPYTHTPWTPSDTTYHSHLLFSNKMHPITFQSRNSTMCYKLRNDTDFPITLRKSNYNAANFQFIKNVISPHSSEIIINDLPEENPLVLMFNIQIGNDERTTDNTANFLASGNSSIGYLYTLSGGQNLWVNNQQVDIIFNSEGNDGCLRFIALAHRVSK